ncbi:MAG: SDR family NAD(P)-dependent oxidoreductase, partial [Pseudomonadota bacterium]
MGNSVVLVTGASRGLGYATAKSLAAPHRHILALGRTTGALEELSDEIAGLGGQSTLIPLDLTDEDGLKRMCRAIHDRWGRLDALIHLAAHAPPRAPADMIVAKDWDKTFAINVHATQRLLALVKPLIPPTGRMIVATDSHGASFFGAYGASKAAQAALVQSLANETRNTGPNVVLFHPAPMPTALRARFYPGENREALTPTEAEAARLLETHPIP